MTNTLTLAPALHEAARSGRPVELAKISRRRYSLTTAGTMLATWEERIRTRWKLKQMSNDDPHLIDDIGMTRRQVEAEIAKPFWQA